MLSTARGRQSATDLQRFLHTWPQLPLFFLSWNSLLTRYCFGVCISLVTRNAEHPSSHTAAGHVSPWTSLQALNSLVNSGSCYLAGELQEPLMPCVSPSTMWLAHSPPPSVVASQLVSLLCGNYLEACHPSVSVLLLGVLVSKP